MALSPASQPGGRDGERKLAGHVLNKRFPWRIQDLQYREARRIPARITDLAPGRIEGSNRRGVAEVVGGQVVKSSKSSEKSDTDELCLEFLGTRL